MKISKLFHWLYAILMLLPAFAIGVTCAYAIFNKNAFQSYYGETINEEQTLTTQELDQHTTYKLLVGNRTFDGTQPNIKLNASNIKRTFSGNTVSYTANIVEIKIQNNTNYLFVYNNNTYVTDFSFSNSSIAEFEFDFIDYITRNELNSTLGTFTYIEYNSYSFVSEVFYYSIDKVQQSPLFNWAYDSFLVTPITYITRLFGMPDNSIVILLMSYWLDISIIYLVFDMIMYVPLLVHRWLDKGVLE